MGKRKVFVILIVLLFVIFGFISFIVFSNKQIGFDIEIKNNTSESISGLGITYTGIGKDIELPEVKAGERYKLNIDPSEDFSENSMIIYYKDKRGYTHKNTLIGYFEKGNKGKATVNMISQDKNGLIMMQIEEKVKY